LKGRTDIKASQKQWMRQASFPAFRLLESKSASFVSFPTYKI